MKLLGLQSREGPYPLTSEFAAYLRTYSEGMKEGYELN